MLDRIALRAILLLGASVVLSACSDSGTQMIDGAVEADAGPADAHPNLDATVTDLGMHEADAAAPDAIMLDAAAADALALPDAASPDANAADASGADASDGSFPDAACVPTGPEICDGIDNDCNGLTDDVDVGHDGIYDCQRIGIFGVQGIGGGSSNFVTWLGSNGLSVQRVLTTGSSSITPFLLSQFDVVIVDDLTHLPTAQEASDFERWVAAGGAAMFMTGYTGGSTDYNQPNVLLAPFSVHYLTALRSGPITQFLPHPTTTGLSSIVFSGGFMIQTASVAGTRTTTVATLTSPLGAAAVAVEHGRGRIFVWGDEWVEYDSQWSSMPQVPIFWRNVLGWISHYL